MKRKIIIVLILFTVSIEILKRIPSVAGFYSASVYPSISHGLHWFSSFFSFSLYDMLIPLLILMLGIILWKCVKRAWKQALFLLLVTLLSGWMAFQLSWGINYFRPDFYSRTGIAYAEADSVSYLKFVDRYLERLNDSYPSDIHLDKEKARMHAVAGFDSIASRFKLSYLPDHPKVKLMTSSDAYAKVGVLGYYGPFFSEVHVNDHLKPQQYPFVLTHELAHLSGVTSEAEANFYAWEITKNSTDSLIRFSAYYSLLPHVLSNAQRILSKERYKEIVSKIDSEIIVLHMNTRDYWDSLYSEKWGAMQNKIYDFYLKNNNIPTGRSNYSEVIGMILSKEEHDSIP